jgi:hypothetical protein
MTHGRYPGHYCKAANDRPLYKKAQIALQERPRGESNREPAQAFRWEKRKQDPHSIDDTRSCYPSLGISQKENCEIQFRLVTRFRFRFDEPDRVLVALNPAFIQNRSRFLALVLRELVHRAILPGKVLPYAALEQLKPRAARTDQQNRRRMALNRAQRRTSAEHCSVLNIAVQCDVRP